MNRECITDGEVEVAKNNVRALLGSDEAARAYLAQFPNNKSGVRRAYRTLFEEFYEKEFRKA